MISEHNRKFPDEMLPKSPEELRKNYIKGLSVVITNENSDLAIAHAALYLINLQPIITGKLYELGSLIVHPDFRGIRYRDGLTIGETAIHKLVEFELPPVIATVKRPNSFRAFLRCGFEPINFSDFPMVSSLTCVCPNSSEYFTKNPCQYRKDKNGRNSCILMAKNLGGLIAIENELKSYFGEENTRELNPQFFERMAKRWQEIKILDFYEL